MKPRSARHLIPTAIVFGLGFVVGQLSEPASTLEADVRKSPARESFKSGGARSEEVLRGIARTLDRIEDRVANIESAVKGDE